MLCIIIYYLSLLYYIKNSKKGSAPVPNPRMPVMRKPAPPPAVFLDSTPAAGTIPASFNGDDPKPQPHLQETVSVDPINIYPRMTTIMRWMLPTLTVIISDWLVFFFSLLLLYLITPLSLRGCLIFRTFRILSCILLIYNPVFFLIIYFVASLLLVSLASCSSFFFWLFFLTFFPILLRMY